MEFEYKAIDATGKMIKDKGEAPTRGEMIESLKAKGLTVIDMKAAAESILEEKPTAKMDFNFEIGVSEKRLLFFTRQFATTLRAGIPILRCLSMLQQQSISSNLQKILEDVSSEIQKGKSLHDAMSNHNPPFDSMYLSMIRVGEKTGDLAKVMMKQADSIETRYELKQKIRSSLSYPIFILVFSVVMVYLMITHLLPMFTPIFRDSGLNIAKDYPITQFLINISKLVSAEWFLPTVILTIGLIYAGLYFGAKSKEGRFFIDNAKFNMPFLHGLVQMEIFSSFCDSMGTLIGSGINILESLSLVADSSSNVVLKQALLDAIESIEKGSSLSTALAKTKIFPLTLVQMVSIGEETGDLDEMFFRVSEYYRRELESTLSSLTALIEPVMMVLVGIMVFFFVVGVLLPIMGISQAYQQNINN